MILLLAAGLFAIGECFGGGVMSFLGVFLLLVPPFGVAKFRRGYRRCRLCVTPAALMVPDPARGYAELTIPGQCVLSITPRTESVGFGSTDLALAQITYSDGGTRTLSVGPAPADDTVWLTVVPANLFAALQEWVRADAGDPGLLDRLDATLRSPTTPPCRRWWDGTVTVTLVPSLSPHPARTGLETPSANFVCWVSAARRGS